MSQPRTASIVISSYNYGRYLNDAIDSALAQTYPNIEVIVVDDGSTDDSAAVIEKYQDRIVPVAKENGGQASAMNAGFGASRGDVLLFLDSDDMLCPTAVDRAMALFEEPSVVKVHWPLVAVDERGSKTGRLIPDSVLPEGDLRQTVIDDGPYGYTWPDTSGNAWARRFLEQIGPIPESEYRTCPDLYLSAFVPLFGELRQIPESQAFYRDHGANNSHSHCFAARVTEGRQRETHCFEALAAYCRSIGVGVDQERWKANAWWHQIERATQDIVRLIPPGDSFILVDEEHWGMGADLAGRRRIPFLERDGEYSGEPPDDETAINEVARLRQAGASFMVFAWPYLWWLDHYAGLRQYLSVTFRCVRESDALVVFDLRP